MTYKKGSIAYLGSKIGSRIRGRKAKPKRVAKLSSGVIRNRSSKTDEYREKLKNL